MGEEELYASALTYFEDENYVQAIESYDELLEQHPFSEHAENASLQVAHAHYLQSQYAKALAGFEDFERLYPISPHLAFVEYSKGMSYLDRTLTSDRDQSNSENAMRHFERLTERYPESIYAALATYRLREARENLATHELYVGDYYLERNRTEAARSRYRYITESYPDTRIAELASARLASMGSAPATAPAAEAAPAGASLETIPFGMDAIDEGPLGEATSEP